MARYAAYLITITTNGKRYVGVTGKSIDHRFKGHARAARAGSPLALHRSMRAHGLESFTVEQVGEADDLDGILALEISLIEKFDSFIGQGRGYNHTRGGAGTLGLEIPEERRKFLSETAARLHADPEFRSRHRSAMEKVWTAPERSKN